MRLLTCTNFLAKIGTISGLFLLFFGFSLLKPEPSQAGLCVDVWNDDCDLIPDTVMPELPGNNFFKVNIRNQTNRTIWVAIHYKGANDNSWASYNSCLQAGDIGARSSCNDILIDWQTEGYWKLEPGQEAYVLGGDENQMTNRYIYFHAHDANGSYWGDNNTTYNVQGEDQPFFQTDMGGTITTYTQSFTD